MACVQQAGVSGLAPTATLRVVTSISVDVRVEGLGYRVKV